MTQHFTLQALDELPITKKTEVTSLKVTIDIPVTEGSDCVFMYNKNHIPNPNNVNIPGIYMFINKLEKCDNGYIIHDGDNRKFTLTNVRK